MRELHSRRYGASATIGTLAFCLLLADLLVASVIDVQPENILGCMITGLVVGQFIGQLNLISVWAAISKGSVVVRLPWALLLTVAMWGAFICSFQLSGETIQQDRAVDFAVMLLIGCLAAQVPLWIASRVYGWQLVRSDLSEDDPSHSQFNIGHMFFSIFLLSISLGLARILLSNLPGQISLVRFRTETIALLIATTICNLLLVVPCIWMAFLMRMTFIRAVAIIAAVAFISLVEFFCLCAILGSPGRDLIEVILIFFFVNLGQVAVVHGSLTILKAFAGFRLERRR